MSNAIIVHGKPSEEKFKSPDNLDPSDSHWIPWVKHQLNIRGIFTVAPDMPHPYMPDYDIWSKELERYDITQDTTLIGLSAGGGFLVDWLGKHPESTIHRLILVAPWTNPKGKYENFCRQPVDPSIAGRCLGGLSIFYSSEDDEQAQESFMQLHEAFPEARTINIPRYGHFMLGNTMETPEFPEIIDEIFN
jgi:predicted alpha/beta hydrolase family esterase